MSVCIHTYMLNNFIKKTIHIYYILYLTTLCGEKMWPRGIFSIGQPTGFISQFTHFQKSYIKSEIKIRSENTALVCVTLMQ